MKSHIKKFFKRGMEYEIFSYDNKENMELLLKKVNLNRDQNVENRSEIN